MLDKSKILAFSRENGGERYVKRFNCWIHLVVMLYAVIMRFDSLIANLLLMVMQKGLKRQWSFSGLATMVRSP